MKISPEVQKTLNGWILTESWAAGHPLDEKRFFTFAEEFADEYKMIPLSKEVEELLRRTLQTKQPVLGDELEKKLRSYADAVVVVARYLASQRI